MNAAEYEKMYPVYAKKFDRIAALTEMVQRLEKVATPPNLMAAIWRHDAITEHFAHYLGNALQNERERVAAEALCERSRSDAFPVFGSDGEMGDRGIVDRANPARQVPRDTVVNPRRRTSGGDAASRLPVRACRLRSYHRRREDSARTGSFRRL